MPSLAVGMRSHSPLRSASTDAAISSINTVGLDHYLLKPWDPPEQNMYPVLDDLLADWQATVPIPFDGIRVAGTLWSATSHDVKDFLARNRIPYQWLDIEKDAGARELVEAIDKPSEFVTGVSDLLPTEKHLEMITTYKPDIKKLAILYNAGEANSKAIVAAVKELSSKFGFTVVEATAPKTAVVYAAAKSLVGRC